MPQNGTRKKYTPHGTFAQTQPAEMRSTKAIQTTAKAESPPLTRRNPTGGIRSVTPVSWCSISTQLLTGRIAGTPRARRSTVASHSSSSRGRPCKR
jgi:hypothetical protein